MVGLWRKDLLAKTRWTKKQEERERRRRAKAKWESEMGEVPEPGSEQFKLFEGQVSRTEIPRSKLAEIHRASQERVDIALAGLCRQRRQEDSFQLAPLVVAHSFPILKTTNGKLKAHRDELEKFLTEDEMRLWIRALNYGDEPTKSYVRVLRMLRSVSLWLQT